MTRKDTILIAVVINAGLLAILFASAIIYDTDKGLEQTELNSSLVDAKEVPPIDLPPNLIATGPIATVDEVDHVLKYYTPSSSNHAMKSESSADQFIPDPIAFQANAADDEDLSQEPATPIVMDNVVEITVKKGDVLEKIARANGTTVSAIKQANNLQHERLSIGQVLKIPLKKGKQHVAAAAQTAAQPKKPASSKADENASAVYYIIKSGDNPWKIAKQFNVKYDDILRLNQLDEDKARNLKVGDRIRVK